MTWRDILVHVKAGEQLSAHTGVAISLAKSFKAHLTGLYTTRNAAVLRRLLGDDAKPAAEVEERERAAALKMEQRFRQALRENGADGDWDWGEGDASELLTLAGRVHDALVVEQTRHGFDEPGWDIAETCAVSSGTPTIVIPSEGTFPSIGQRILVAWNGSRQAAAALHGALPLVELARHVTVAIGNEKERSGSIARFPRRDIAGYLKRHTPSVSSLAFEANDWEAGARLLELAGQTDSDLLVMGAYGRSAFQEFILGGATRYVFKHMNIPVLMAH
jgi:nucleotide-binding universal stress UspA family protein